MSIRPVSMASFLFSCHISVIKCCDVLGMCSLAGHRAALLQTQCSVLLAEKGSPIPDTPCFQLPASSGLEGGAGRRLCATSPKWPSALFPITGGGGKNQLQNVAALQNLSTLLQQAKIYQADERCAIIDYSLSTVSQDW